MIVLFCLSMALSLALGFALGCICDRKGEKTPCEENKDILEMEKRNAERARREYQNFLTYDGTTQDDIIL